MPSFLSVDVLECRGSPYEIGHQLAERLRALRGARALRPAGNVAIEGFELQAARAALRSYAPNVWEELHGISDGLGLPLDRTVAAFSNGRLRYPQRGCSAVLGGGVYGRNYDFTPRRYDCVLIAIQSPATHASIGFAERYTGRLDGMNDQGLCIGLHYVNDAGWRPGLASPLIVRIILDQCATAADAADLLCHLPHGLAFNYSIMDRHGEAAVVEASPDRVVVRRADALACTNHFQSPELEHANSDHVRASQRRLSPLEEWAGQGLAAGELFLALNDARSAAFHHGYAAGHGTLHTLVAEPASGALTIGIGANAAPRRIDVPAWAQGAALGFDRLRGRLGAKDDKLFRDRDLAGAEFRNVSLAGARFDDINFAGAEISAYCNFKGMRLAGIPVEELFAAYRERRGR